MHITRIIVYKNKVKQKEHLVVGIMQNKQIEKNIKLFKVQITINTLIEILSILQINLSHLHLFDHQTLK